jgi:hypothetical protein
MPPLETEMIEARLRELSVKELILNTQIGSLTEELVLLRRQIEQLKQAKSKLVNHNGVDSLTGLEYTTRDVSVVNRVVTTRRRRKLTAVVQKGSIKEDALRALSDNRTGLLALDVLAHINERRDPPIARTSLSPQLSRLRQAGLVSEAGSVWRITQAGLDALKDLHS